jgi:sugar O-acyltransferase (sialic acid O-acetyltransferase NeuD family)
MTVFAFYSAGGFARETYEGFLHSQEAVAQSQFEVLFIDDDPTKHGTSINDLRVISYDEAKTIPGIRINVAFAPPSLRRKKVEQCDRDGLQIFSSFASTAIIGPNVTVGDGAIFSYNSMVTSDAIIGRAFHCNIYSYVAHDCIVGDFVTFAPRVSLNGRIKVEDDVYVGTGAIILPGKDDRYLTIGKGAVIGAGAVVTKDVEPGAVMVGAPAKARQ